MENIQKDKNNLCDICGEKAENICLNVQCIYVNHVLNISTIKVLTKIIKKKQ